MDWKNLFKVRKYACISLFIRITFDISRPNLFDSNSKIFQKVDIFLLKSLTYIKMFLYVTPINVLHASEAKKKGNKIRRK